MALNLDNNCKNKLIKSLTKNLESVVISKYNLPKFKTLYSILDTQKILPQLGIIHDNINKYMGENALLYFICEIISRNIITETRIEKDIPLTNFSSYKDLNESAKDLIEKFDSLPWKFLFSFEINENVSSALKSLISNYKLSPEINISIPNNEFDEIFPLKSQIDKSNHFLYPEIVIGSKFIENWNKNRLYLQIEIDGFTGEFIHTPINETILSSIKSIFGLLISTYLLEIEAPPLFLGMLPYYSIPVHRKINNKWKLWASMPIPPEISLTLDCLKFNDKLYSNREQKWIKKRFDEVSAALKNNENLKRIRHASEWLFESYLVGQNDLLSFLKSVIALEILLGDKKSSDIVGISELLGNRCAYLIGTSIEERKQIIGDFKKIYKLRSYIVHEGKNSLSVKELNLFKEARWMCSRIIYNELQLILKEKKSQV